MKDLYDYINDYFGYALNNEEELINIFECIANFIYYEQTLISINNSVNIKIRSGNATKKSYEVFANGMDLNKNHNINVKQIVYFYTNTSYEIINKFLESIKFDEIIIGKKKDPIIYTRNDEETKSMWNKTKIEVGNEYRAYNVFDKIYIIDKIKDCFMHLGNDGEPLFSIENNKIKIINTVDDYSLKCEIPIEALNTFIRDIKNLQEEQKDFLIPKIISSDDYVDSERKYFGLSLSVSTYKQIINLKEPLSNKIRKKICRILNLNYADFDKITKIILKEKEHSEISKVLELAGIQIPPFRAKEYNISTLIKNKGILTYSYLSCLFYYGKDIQILPNGFYIDMADQNVIDKICKVLNRFYEFSFDKTNIDKLKKLNKALVEYNKEIFRIFRNSFSHGNLVQNQQNSNTIVYVNFINNAYENRSGSSISANLDEIILFLDGISEIKNNIITFSSIIDELKIILNIVIDNKIFSQIDYTSHIEGHYVKNLTLVSFAMLLRDYLNSGSFINITEIQNNNEHFTIRK